MFGDQTKCLLSSSDVSHAIRSAVIDVSEKVKSTYGPKGRDKLIVNQENGNLIVTNDGATILRNINFRDPVAQLLVRLSQAQDNEVGDGTTGVILLASQLVLHGLKLIERRLHPHHVVQGYKMALEHSLRFLHEVSQVHDDAGRQHAVMTVFNSKVVRHHADLFSRMLIEGMCIGSSPGESLNIHKIAGGSIGDSELIHGVVFRRPFVYAGYEMQPQHIHHPRILLLDHELEHKHQHESSRIVIDDVTAYPEYVDAEWRVLLDKLTRIQQSGATVVLSRQAIGDVAMQFFARCHIYAVGRVPPHALQTLETSLDVPILSTFINDDLSRKTSVCQRMTERTFGDDRYIVLEGCPTPAATILLRGGSAEVLDEVERSVEDGARVCAGLMHREHRYVPGGGAGEIMLHHVLKEEAGQCSFHLQTAMDAFAEALLEIPMTLALNADMDVGDVMAQIKSDQYSYRHNNSHSHSNNRKTSPRIWIDVDRRQVSSSSFFHPSSRNHHHANDVREAFHVKSAMLSAATEAAASLLPLSAMVVHPPAAADTEEASRRAEVARQRRIAERQMRKEKNRSRGEIVLD
eukprot:gb/GECH01007264.1/.p1 GENE.gb/GECH01007264.1/~~gb/GECH01007264.1/.p1  ORF type:complete len:576 (+),score=132.20 gb/GECH01007264.1/:1-1728(+)